MSNYVYKDPRNEGYEKIKLTKEEHEHIFKRKPNRMRKEYYKRGNLYRVDYFEPLWVKVVNILLYPVLLLSYGLSNIKEINSDIRSLFHQKEKGNFYSDYANLK